jgi:hypothetical protein
MPPEVLENIFEPFFTRRRVGKGSGLGLSITHRIVSQHHGEIHAVSPGEGLGATFSVRLPVQPREITSPRPPKVNDDPSTNELPAVLAMGTPREDEPVEAGSPGRRAG